MRKNLVSHSYPDSPSNDPALTLIASAAHKHLRGACRFTENDMLDPAMISGILEGFTRAFGNISRAQLQSHLRPLPRHFVSHPSVLLPHHQQLTAHQLSEHLQHHRIYIMGRTTLSRTAKKASSHSHLPLKEAI